jgi:uncharacterized membrane protein YeaQ/YmgE (transglycosylase-associated protein family)
MGEILFLPIISVVVGASVGWLAGISVKSHGFGLITNMVVGIIGAMFSSLLLQYFGVWFGRDAFIGFIINAVIGAVILLVIIGLMRRIST